MKLRRNPKILVGGSVLLTTIAVNFAALLTFDRYPIAIKVVLLLGWLVGGALQILGSLEEGKRTKERAASI